MKNYKLLNLLSGWVVFLAAAIVYLLTIEPTASFWDCGEFISTAYKLEVGHPPGAPFFMLLGRFFTLFAGEPENAAMSVNVLSALASAFTILFLFWSITHLARKVVNKSNESLTSGNVLAILGSGLVGALAYTFSDTFWFSAVEAEVYATSSLITAIVFWAILKWENEADQKHSNRWLILIAYLVGLSLGVHLLNLLAIPAIVFVFYFRKYKTTPKGVLTAAALSVIILLSIMYLIISGVVSLGSKFELLFVNGLGLPFNSGILFYTLLVIGLIVFGLYYSHKKGKYILNTVILCVTVILIGYSSYASILIRSNADPPMDQNNPENVFNFLSYLNREQYGDRPLLYGHYYNAPVEERKQGEPVYAPGNARYEVVDHRTDIEYDSRFTGFFPRMYSSDKQHVEDYKSWVNIDGKKVSVEDRQGNTTQKTVPSVTDNLVFFFKYQVGHMYWRYFMWNFSGRQNDIQGHGNVRDGNWKSGIPAIDNPRLGDQDNLPDHLKNNPANNKYYMLPFLLGIIGLVFHYKKDKKDFSVVMMLFILTGIAIVFYLNQSPHQPRERDYAYAGSFYAFAIWIGFSVMAIYQQFRKGMPQKVAAITSGIVLLGVPALMASENWDDHDRSGRYTTRDFAINYLNSCRKNGILFTNGDNDTYPLWYAQEVEGIRTDVRVANLSYLRAGWYVEQLMRKAYESDPLPLTHKTQQLKKGSRDVVPVMNRIEGPVSIDKVIDFVASENSRTKMKSPFDRSKKISFFPTNHFKIEIDSAKVVSTETVAPKDSDFIVPEMKWKINRQYLLKDGVTIMDMLATNDWERPIHYAVTVSDNKHYNLGKYLQLEGLAYHLTPLKLKSKSSAGKVNTDRMYDLFMNKFKWGGIDKNDVYLNEDNRRMLNNFRNNYGRLAEALVKENKNDSAEKVMDYCLEKIDDSTLAYEFTVMPFIENYYKIGEAEKANHHLEILAETLDQEMSYYTGLGERAAQFSRDIRRNMYIINNLSDVAEAHGQSEWKERLLESYDKHMKKLEQNLQLMK
ncbi:MAG: glycosyltransferase family 117 protein [Bacteroidota bacterium]